MGIIINLSDSDKRYASINTNTVNITKQIMVLFSEDENGDLIKDANDDFIILDNYKLTGYNLECVFNIWDNETDYNRRDKSNVTYTLEVKASSPTVPENVYDILYTKIKELYPSYTDDI
jgi:hypothetical protein